MATQHEPRAQPLTVVLSGAESAGKTTLAESLAQHFGVPWVAEFAREYLTGRSAYGPEDLLAIAEGQLAAEAALAAAHRLLIVDTDLLVIEQWALVRYGEVAAPLRRLVEDLLVTSRPRLYLVPRPDIPWHPDPLREHPTARPELHAIHVEMLQRRGLAFEELSGTLAERLEQGITAIRRRTNGVPS